MASLTFLAEFRDHDTRSQESLWFWYHLWGEKTCSWYQWTELFQRSTWHTKDTDRYNYCSLLTSTFEWRTGLGERTGCSCVAMAVAAVDTLCADVQGPLCHRQTLASLWHFEADILQVEVRGRADQQWRGLQPGWRQRDTLPSVLTMILYNWESLSFKCLLTYSQFMISARNVVWKI